MTSSPEFDDQRERDAGERAAPKPLDPSTRARMERALGGDLGRVRVRRDPEAHAAADREDARALTRQHEIALARDAADPATSEGERLLAHELAHVLQQERQGPSADRETLEAEADQAAEAVSQ